MRRPSHKSRAQLSLALGLLVLGPAAGQGETTTVGGTVTMPPFIVSDSRTSPLHWRYGEFDHFQVLSTCSSQITVEFMRELYSLEEQLRWLLPAQFRFQTSAPVSYILCDASLQQQLDQDIPIEMFLDHNGQPKPAPPVAGLRQHFVTVPHLGLQDDDAYMTFALLDSDFLQRGQMSYLPDAVERLLKQRTPPLPTWFISGFMYLYGSMTFTRPGKTYGEYQSTDGSFVIRAPIGGLRGAGAMCAPFTWISPQEGVPFARKISQRIANHQEVGPLLLPMEDLLVKPNPPAGPSVALDHYRRVWVAQAALFVRCGLDNDVEGTVAGVPPWRDCFWKFVARSSAEPVTPTLLRECFGLNFEQMREQLARYLLIAVAQVGEVGITPGDQPRPLVRDATPGEIARIEGDWERLEVGFVTKAFPALSAAYREHARQTLWHGYDRGDRDPRLLAAMGLYACDAGDDRAAQPLLEAAIKARVLRPRAYYELARIRYAQAAAKPLGANNKLDAAQTVAVLAPLAEARKQSPPLLAASELFANVRFHSDLAPARPDLAELDADTVLFPRSSGLVFQAALLEAQAGHMPEANRLIDRGLLNADDGPGKARLVQLRTLLASPATAR